MSELATVARPYAKAVFELAQQSGDLARWSEMINIAADITKDPKVQTAIQHPKVSGDDLAVLYGDIAGNKFDQSFGNLLKVLLENRRMTALPAIAEQFESLRREHEARIKVTIVTAQTIEQDQYERLAAALKKRYQKDIELVQEVQPDLLGGAVIYAGDEVINGTVRGRLEKMSTQLSRQ